jgi:polyribonucleotide nucleotidyltransferase
MLPDQSFTTHVGNAEVTVSTGKLAYQAGGAVTLRVDDSMVLATATMSKTVRDIDFFPLSVDFEEKMYAAGRIPGSFFRREARPSTDAILTARLTDRPLRPLFPKGMRNEVQVIVTALSSDSVRHLDIMALNAASAALTISDIPWNGPIGAVRVGQIDGQLVANPTIPEMSESSLDLRIAASKDAIIMVEAGANEVSETLLMEALAFGQEAVQPFIALQEELQAAAGKEKREVELPVEDTELKEAVLARLGGRVAEIVAAHTDRSARNKAMNELRDEVVDSFLAEDDLADPRAIRAVITSELTGAIRHRILHDGIRPDGRDYTTVRALSSEVSISPRAHGSGLFQRGETQVLSLVALGTPREAQKLDGLYPRDSRRFMHHYNFPPYSTGETWFLRGPKRREIGHGALGETALRPMIPTEEEFPYTIRVVSEVLSSNGSTSQASICAASLALMDCGVPIKKPVAGELMAQALEQARVARLEILDSMEATMPEPRTELSPFAPRMLTVKIDPEKIGAVIGKGGATIRSIQETFEVSVDVQEDGTVFVAGVDGNLAESAVEHIKTLTIDPEPGTIYTGKVIRITDFGAFVEFVPGTDGLIHISQISSEHLQRVEDALQLGDEVMVMVTDITPDGKVRLSRKAVLEGWSLEEARSQDRGGARRGGNRRGGGRGNRYDRGNRGRR